MFRAAVVHSAAQGSFFGRAAKGAPAPLDRLTLTKCTPFHLSTGGHGMSFAPILFLLLPPLNKDAITTTAQGAKVAQTRAPQHMLQHLSPLLID